MKTPRITSILLVILVFNSKLMADGELLLEYKVEQKSPHLKSLPVIDFSDNAVSAMSLNEGDLSGEIRAAAASSNVEYLGTQLTSPDLRKRWQAVYALGLVEDRRVRADAILNDYIEISSGKFFTSSGNDDFMRRVVDKEARRSIAILAPKVRNQRWSWVGGGAVISLILALPLLARRGKSLLPRAS